MYRAESKDDADLALNLAFMEDYGRFRYAAVNGATGELHRFNRQYDNLFWKLIKSDPAQCGVSESIALAAMPECDDLPMDVNGTQAVAAGADLEVPPELMWTGGGYYEMFGPQTVGWSGQFHWSGFAPSGSIAAAAIDVVQEADAFCNIHEWLGTGWPAVSFPQCCAAGNRYEEGRLSYG